MAWHKQRKYSVFSSLKQLRCSRKGEEPAGISLWFAIFYSFLTAVVALSMVFMPKALMDKNAQPIPVDATSQAQQTASRLWVTNSYTGRTNPFEFSTDLKDIDKLYTTKLLTYKITIDGKSAIYDEPFYKIAKPLAVHKYQPYNEKRTVSAGGKPATLEIEELYPKKYAVKK